MRAAQALMRRMSAFCWTPSWAMLVLSTPVTSPSKDRICSLTRWWWSATSRKYVATFDGTCGIDPTLKRCRAEASGMTAGLNSRSSP